MSTGTGMARRWWIWALAAVVAVGWPFVVHDKFFYHVGVMFCLTAIGAASLHMIVRTGHVSLCHGAFMGLGAYGCVLSVMKLGLPWPVGLVIGGLVSALVAIVVGPVVLRLTGKYFVLVTFIFGEIVRMVFIDWQSLTGGSNGIFDIPAPWPAFAPSRPDAIMNYYFLALALAALCVGFVARLLGSEYGRMIDSIREAERLAECSGVPVVRTKVTVFVLACFLVGLEGGLLAHYLRYIGPESFTAVTSLNLVVMNVIGGMTSLAGAMLGTVFMVLLPELLSSYEIYQPILFGFILFVTMAFMPGGLIEMGRRLAGLPRRRSVGPTGGAAA